MATEAEQLQEVPQTIRVAWIYFRADDTEPLAVPREMVVFIPSVSQVIQATEPDGTEHWIPWDQVERILIRDVELVTGGGDDGENAADGDEPVHPGDGPGGGGGEPPPES